MKSLDKLMDIQKPQPQNKDKKEESDIYKGFILKKMIKLLQVK